MASTRTKPGEIVEPFSTPEGPRSPINRRHPRPSIPVIAAPAVLAAAAGPTAIARWAGPEEDLLARPLDPPRGIPGKDVFRRVLMTLRPAAFEAALNAWIARLRDQAGAETLVDRPIIALGGESARRGHDAGEGLGPPHVVTAWAGEYGLALGQEACAVKSNEITAIPESLKEIDARGGVVTIDAMGAPKAFAEQIIRGQADHVPAPRGDRETPHRTAVGHIDEQREGDREGAEELRRADDGQGREERRAYPQRPVPADLPGRGEWKGLKSVAPVRSRRVEGDREGIEMRPSLSRLPVGVEPLARAVSGHRPVGARAIGPSR